MMCNNSNVDLVNMNANIKFGEIMSICSQDIGRKQILAYFKGHNTGTNVRKMICNNSNVDLVNMNTYKKFGEILSICSQDDHWK